MSEEPKLEPLQPDVLEQLRQVSTSTLATQLYRRGFRQPSLVGVRALSQVADGFVGEAFTMRFIPAREDVNPLDPYRSGNTLQWEAIEQVPPGQVIVVDSRGDASAASGGDMLMTRAMVRGAAGFVTDGGLRDGHVLSRMPFATYASQVTITTRAAYHHVADLQVPIGCAGVAVYPGDVLVGDRDGVVVVPRGLAAEVAGPAVEQERLEAFIGERIKAGAPLWGNYPPSEQTKAEYRAGVERASLEGGPVVTVRLTVAQAVVRFLANQWSERDGVERRLIPGCFGIFGHGNVAGVGQALLQAQATGADDLPYYLSRNEQAMVHAAVGYARTLNRLQTLACTASVGPGSTNMLTGAALATVNRIPVLLLPSDIFATRVGSPVLQELEQPYGYDVSVNDAFRPLSRFFDRVWRPEQLPAALLGAMRVLTDPAETGAATIALPQDVQAEAADWPVELFGKRVWHVGRPVPEPAALARAVDAIRGARRPLLVAGGGVIYAEATEALRRFAEATGIPVADTQAGKGAIRWDHPQSVGGVGSTGSQAANALARDADVVIGVGTRYSDFTTASRTAFQHPRVRFVNLNVASLDAAKHAGVMLQADARVGLEALTDALTGHRVEQPYADEARRLVDDWQRIVEDAYHLDHQPLPAQTAVLGALNDVMTPDDTVVQAAGSMPGDLQMLWRAADPKQYHVEYGFSCMGYEIAGALGIKMAAPQREVFALVGDGSYLMMAQEIATAVSENIKLVVVIVQNHGFASIGDLSEKLGSQRFGTFYRYRNDQSGKLDGGKLPIDLAANAESLGADVIRVKTIDELRDALRRAKESTRTTAVHIETDPLAPVPSSNSWWDVPVSAVSELDSTQQARKSYEAHKADQRPYLTRGDGS